MDSGGDTWSEEDHYRALARGWYVDWGGSFRTTNGLKLHEYVLQHIKDRAVEGNDFYRRAVSESIKRQLV